MFRQWSVWFSAITWKLTHWVGSLILKLTFFILFNFIFIFTAMTRGTLRAGWIIRCTVRSTLILTSSGNTLLPVNISWYSISTVSCQGTLKVGINLFYKYIFEHNGTCNPKIGGSVLPCGSMTLKSVCTLWPLQSISRLHTPADLSGEPPYP